MFNLVKDNLGFKSSKDTVYGSLNIKNEFLRNFILSKDFRANFDHLW